MAFIDAHFFSNVLQKHVGMYVIVPENKPGPFPVFYLLHGLSDDYTIWQRRTRIEFYVRDLPLIVAMPDGFRGFYTDNAAGPAYGKYMIEDVIGFIERTFPAVGKREGRCIGGLSMGGYGSMRLGLEHPELFVSLNSHSGSVTPWDSPEVERKRVFGDHPLETPHDLMWLASKLLAESKVQGPKSKVKSPKSNVQSQKSIPKLLVDCGTEDFLYQQNQALRAHFDKIKFPYEYREFRGDHNWDYWDEHIREALDFHCQALGIGAHA